MTHAEQTTDLLLPGWERTDDHNIKRVVDAETGLCIHQYPNYASQFCCHIIRGSLRYCPGLVYSLAAAYDACEQHLALPLDEFKRLVVADLLEDLRKLHEKIAALDIEAATEDYKAGFSAGQCSAQKEIKAQIDLLFDLQAAA